MQQQEIQFPSPEFTKTQIESMLDSQNWPIVNRWLARGDGIAVYENHNIGSDGAGHRQFPSFGSSAAQLETETPPKRLPDIGGHINWAYQLIGTYRGALLGS